MYALTQVLARIGLTQTEFQRVLNSILDLFTVDRRLLEVRGSLIVRKLCVLLNARSIYMTLAEVLQSERCTSPLYIYTTVLQLCCVLLLGITTVSADLLKLLNVESVRSNSICHQWVF